MAIDYSLEHLTQQITEYKPYPEASVAIIDEGLTYMASSEDSTAVLKETVFTRLSRGGLEVDTLVLNNVRAHRDGHTLIKQGSYQNPYRSYLYHSVVPNTGWTILMNCPETVLTELLTNYRLRMTFVAFTVCLLVIVVALSFMKYK